MDLNIKNKIEQVVNVFETGVAEGDYGNVSIYADGTFPNGKRGVKQVTFGRSQTTEQGNLKALLEIYIEKGGQYSEQFKPYLPQFNKLEGSQTVLSTDKAFHALLKNSALDPLMKSVQDEFFDKTYFQNAAKWATDNGFKYPLSMLVIYDSFIHSGRMFLFLQNAFPEKKPIQSGDEKKWIIDYVKARHKWLENHKDPILRKTVYRMKAFMDCFEKNNWELSEMVKTNGVSIK